jgi:hypothetical protein
MIGEARPRLGAYGLELSGLDDAADLLSPIAEGRPILQVLQVPSGMGEQGRADATIRLEGGGRLQMEREPLRACFHVPAPLGPEELVHPYLVPAAAVAVDWHGLHAFHAGAFVADGGVWGVLGERGDGKSSLLASMALRGVEVMADDLLVIGDEQAYCGPRAVDLREDAARQLGVGDPLGLVGQRERWRFRLPHGHDPLPLRGWVVLGWGEQRTLEPVPPADRVRRLLHQRTLPASPLAPPVGLLTKPMFLFRRERGWSRLGGDVGELLAAVETLV